MFITFSDGTKLEARIYTQTGQTMRVALQGVNDLVDFTCIRGQWVSENCEPVDIEFEWQRISTKKYVTEADYICSQELASLLVQYRLSGRLADGVKVLGSGSMAG